MEFRVSREARARLGFDEVLFSSDGDALVVEADRAERFAERLVEGEREAVPRVTLELSALGLIHELCHRGVAVERRRAGRDGGPLRRALRALGERIGPARLGATLEAFEAGYPATPVYAGRLTPTQWLARADAPVGGREEALEELLLLWLANQNPAAAPYAELFDDTGLAATPYAAVITALRGTDLAPDMPDPDRAAPARRLVDRLLAPLVAAPYSLADQLRYIRGHWAGWLDEADLARIDRELDALAAEERASWLRFRRPPPGDGRPDAAALHGFGADGEPEGFSPDLDWMPHVVLLAKSTYVWLDQLSRRHGRHIQRLDQVPDEELDEIAHRGFTGLWLIGVWERSPASARIKQWRGNPDAVASAYSVADYRIADDLGGDAAWRDLRDRAASCGVRLASDMVPNHMGIDSRWVVEHPERFISRPDPPFAAYTFGGADISSDERVAIHLEDHYWDSSDAAVVFKRVDRVTGETHYIYHGNDGTSFPWNDTAQLDYLAPEVREAVIGQILDVARRFPIIRFDAAMVLTKRHIQRLWYPPTGHEAGIPSRSSAAMSRADFERAVPVEFWREVVDRVAAEVPDTLLLAEAFWLLEGYFVRSLGMHRVYNSAFMHMLRDERNADYQKVMRETIAFDARILGRYVNFMNNPDERTAIDQFGSGDKYFGVATLLATLPGLPMFGHGQVEGLHEKYGMEFRRAATDERPDPDLVARHEREIFPLLRDRWRFASAERFTLLEASDESGSRLDDVFAYANRAPSSPPGIDPRSLVVYLNRYDRARVRVPGVADALGLSEEAGRFVVLRDRRSGLDYLRATPDIAAGGLELELEGYRCHVFLEFEEVADGPAREWSRLAWRLGLRGTPDIRAALRRMLEEPFREAVAELVALEVLGPVIGPGPVSDILATAVLSADVRGRIAEALGRLADAAGSDVDHVRAADVAAGRLARIGSIPRPLHRAALAGWSLGAAMGEVGRVSDPDATEEAFGAWGADACLGAALRASGARDSDAWRAAELARALLVIPVGPDAVATEPPDALAAGGVGMPAWIEHPAVLAASGANEWQGRRFIVREAWDELVDVVGARDALLDVPAATARTAALKAAAARAGYVLGAIEG